jgi:hypothetical protein
MSTAQYLPVWCGACGRAQLQRVPPGDVSNCRSCGVPTSVLPGQTYVEADAALFERIQAAVLATPLGRRTAEQVEKELRDVAIRGDAPEAVLLHVLDHLPGLHFLLPALQLQPSPALERALLVRATGMLLTIVVAHAKYAQLLSARTG